MATRTDETEIEQVQGVLAEFSRVEAGLAELRAKHGNVVYEVTTTAGFEAAKAARAEIRAPRYAVEQVRKAAKAPLLALGKRIDVEAMRITEAILEVERPVDEQIKAEEARRLADREAKRAAEVERLRQEAAEKLRVEQEQLAAEREKLAAERAAIEAAAAEQRRKAEAEALAARQKAEAEAAALRKRAAEEAAAAKREADMELAAQRKAIAEAKEKSDREAAAERARLKAERAATERVAAEQAAEAERLSAEWAAIQSRPAVVPAVEVVGIDDAAGPLDVWDKLKANWETLDLNDHDAVETFCLCCLEQGEQQARQLIEARERIDGVVRLT